MNKEIHDLLMMSERPTVAVEDYYNRRLRVNDRRWFIAFILICTIFIGAWTMKVEGCGATQVKTTLNKAK